MFAGGVRPVERAFALPAVEAAEVAARERSPEDAVAVDVAAARPITGKRRLVDLGKGGTRGIGPGIHAHDIAREGARGAPDASVHWVHRDGIQTGDHSLVLGRIDRRVGLDPFVALAVAVGVEHERRPPLRALFVPGFLEETAVEPAEHRVARAAGAGPERV